MKIEINKTTSFHIQIVTVWMATPWNNSVEVGFLVMCCQLLPVYKHLTISQFIKNTSRTAALSVKWVTHTFQQCNTCSVHHKFKWHQSLGRWCSLHRFDWPIIKSLKCLLHQFGWLQSLLHGSGIFSNSYIQSHLSHNIEILLRMSMIVVHFTLYFIFFLMNEFDNAF